MRARGWLTSVQHRQKRVAAEEWRRIYPAHSRIVGMTVMPDNTSGLQTPGSPRASRQRSTSLPLEHGRFAEIVIQP